MHTSSPRQFSLITFGLGLALAACGEASDSAPAPYVGIDGSGATSTATGGTGALSGTGAAHATGGMAPTSGGTAGTGAASPATGGTPSAGGTGGTNTDGPFTLLWQDDFETLDSSRWGVSGHTFSQNVAVFHSDNVVVENGLLKLRVTHVPREDKSYTAGEVYTKQSFKYGRIEARIKFHQGVGMVSSLFTYNWDIDVRWNEIDIEYLGSQPQALQYNLITSPYGDPWAQNYQVIVDDIGAAPYGEFYDYRIDWTPEHIKMFVNGFERAHYDNVGDFTEEMDLRMNCWPTNHAEFPYAGELQGAVHMPAEAQYDWVRLYSYTP